jgi:hypothetical protein
MYGAHEEELMRSAAFWAGKTTRSQQSYDHNLDDKTTSRQFCNALEREELSPATRDRPGYSCAAPPARWSSSSTGPTS